MSTEIVPLGTAISREHRKKLDALKAKTRTPIRTLIESWIDAASSRLSSKKRRAKT